MSQRDLHDQIMMNNSGYVVGMAIVILIIPGDK